MKNESLEICAKVVWLVVGCIAWGLLCPWCLWWCRWCRWWWWCSCGLCFVFSRWTLLPLLSTTLPAPAIEPAIAPDIEPAIEPPWTDDSSRPRTASSPRARRNTSASASRCFANSAFLSTWSLDDRATTAAGSAGSDAVPGGVFSFRTGFGGWYP